MDHAFTDADLRRPLTDFEKRLAAAAIAADRLQRTISREYHVEIAVGHEVYAQARCLVHDTQIQFTGPNGLFGFPFLAYDSLALDQIVVRASLNIA